MNNLIFHTFRFYFETVFKYLSAPVYVFVAQWDSYQLQELVHSKFPTMRLPPELPSEAEYLGKFGKNTHRSLRRVGILRKKASFDNLTGNHLNVSDLQHFCKVLCCFKHFTR